MTAQSEMSASAASRVETAASVLDAAVAKVGEQARSFARLDARAKEQLLAEVQPRLLSVVKPWVEAAAAAKGLALGTPVSSEEWLAGPMATLRNVRLLRRSLTEVAAAGKPMLPKGFQTTASGRVEAPVFPADGLDGTLTAGVQVSVRFQQGVSATEARERQASFYSKKDPEGGVSLVLGAGNVASIPPMDVFYKMFVEGRTCVLKMNPVNEYLGPFFEEAFKPWIDRGYLAVVYGGAEAGRHLVAHPGVHDVHITGSVHTHDLMVWGPAGPERERRIREQDPVLKKPITSELGCVTPVVIAPARFSAKELAFLAENVATMLANNGSFNCDAAAVLVTSKGWAQREEFLTALRAVLGALPPRRSYYPGARERYQKAVEGRERVERLGTGDDQKLPWTLVSGLDPKRAAEPLFETESFCPILAEVPLEESDATAFLAAATAFCNERLWGTLSMTLVVHPSLEKDPTTRASVEQAIDGLRYGAVTVNHFPGIVYGFVTPPWGGHPSGTLADAQSGLGWVHNTYMLEGIEKSVLRGPLTMFPKPPWFVTHGNAHEVARRLVEFEGAPSWLKVPGIALAALRG